MAQYYLRVEESDNLNAIRISEIINLDVNYRSSRVGHRCLSFVLDVEKFVTWYRLLESDPFVAS